MSWAVQIVGGEGWKERNGDGATRASRFSAHPVDVSDISSNRPPLDGRNLQRLNSVLGGARYLSCLVALGKAD